jgi:hypothetical protein
MANQAGGMGHITQHVIRLQFERARRAVGETPLEDLERIVQARAPSRSQKAALRSRIRPLPIFARSRGHCSDQAMKRFVQD